MNYTNYMHSFLHGMMSVFHEKVTAEGEGKDK